MKTQFGTPTEINQNKKNIENHSENTSFRVPPNAVFGIVFFSFCLYSQCFFDHFSFPGKLKKIKQLRRVTYDWKDDDKEKGFQPAASNETGVIAQEVQKVIPDAVVPAPFDENYLTVKHEKLIPLLIEAIKEQQEQIEELKQQVQDLGNQK